MINLEDISKKISNVLNGTDNETSEISRNNSYMAYEYVVQTEGFQLDYNYNMASGKNFIPVFVGSLGGAYNPVANPAEVKIDKELAIKWLKNGAEPTDTVRNLLSQNGILKEYHEMRMGK